MPTPIKNPWRFEEYLRTMEPTTSLKNHPITDGQKSRSNLNETTNPVSEPKLIVTGSKKEFTEKDAEVTQARPKVEKISTKKIRPHFTSPYLIKRGKMVRRRHID